MAPRAQYQGRRAGRRVHRDAHRRAGRGPRDPPADPDQRQDRRSLRFDHLWQGRPRRSDDRGLHGRRQVPRRGAQLHGSAPLWQRHHHRFLCRDGAGLGRPADRPGDAELYRPAGRAVGDLHAWRQRLLPGHAEPLCDARGQSRRRTLGGAAVRAPRGGGQAVSAANRGEWHGDPARQRRIDPQCRRDRLLPLRTARPRLGPAYCHGRKAARRRSAGFGRFALRQLPCRARHSRTIARRGRTTGAQSR